MADEKGAWADALAELAARREGAAAMGGPEGIDRQRRRGKLTARERVDLLIDPGSFREFMGLVGSGEYDDTGALKGFTPKPMVFGNGRVGDREVVVSADDFTVSGGTASAGEPGAIGAELTPAERAREWLVPYVRLLDSGGGSIASFAEIGRSYVPDANRYLQNDVALLGLTPVVSVVLGAAAGIRAVETRLAHFSVIAKEQGHVFVGGPPVVRAALNQEVTKEELGGWAVHTRRSGVVDNAADTEQEAIAQARRFLSYLPSSVFELPPRGQAPEARQDPEPLLSLVPEERRQVYDMRRLVRLCVDEGSFFEIAPAFGRSRITGLARVDGHPVGVMANNPKHGGGATDVAAATKATRLIQLCDTFHLPLLSFADEPGVTVGLDSELAGIETAGVRLVGATCGSRIPWLTIVVRRLFGVGGMSHQRPSGMFRRYAWPSARWGSMHIEGGAAAAFRRQIEAAPNPEAQLAEFEAALRRLESPFRTAEATGQDIVDPRSTPELVLDFVRQAQRVLATQVGPPASPWQP